MKRIIVAFLAVAFSTMSCGAIAHGVPPHVVKPVVAPVVKTVVPTASSGVNWFPFVAVAAAIGYAVYQVHECDKKPLTDACHPAAVRAAALRAAAVKHHRSHRVAKHKANRRAHRAIAARRKKEACARD